MGEEGEEDIFDEENQGEEGEVGQVEGTGREKPPKLSDEELLERWRSDEKWRLAGIGVTQKEKMETLALMQEMRIEKQRREEDHVILEEFHDEKAYSLTTVFAEQSEQTRAKRENVLSYMENVKAMRARFLHDVLNRVIEEQNQKYTIDLAARCLRRLRVQMMQRNAMAFFKRSRLKNWCRLAARFRYLDRGMPVYRRYRVLWKMWQKWLRFLRKQYMYMQPSLGHEVRRRKELLHKFSDLLDDGMPEEEASSGIRTLFYRWLEHTQSQCVRRRLAKLFSFCHDTRLLQRAFGALRSSRKVRYASKATSKVLYAERCTQTEISKWKVRFLVFERRMASAWTRRKNAYARRKLREHTLKKDTLKKQEVAFKAEVMARLHLEQRLLFEDFEKRGTFLFEDRDVLMHSQATLAEDENEAEAPSLRVFTDSPVPASVRVVRVIVYASEVVHGVYLVLQPGRGFTGGSRVSNSGVGSGGSGHGGVGVGSDSRGRAAAGGPGSGSGGNSASENTDAGAANPLPATASFEMPLRGYKAGKEYSFDLEDGELLVAIEGSASNTVESLRFYTSTGRASQWYGRAANANSTLMMGDPFSASALEYGPSMFMICVICPYI